MKITDETPPYYCPASPLRGITHIDARCAGLETLTRGRSLFRGSSLVTWERDMPLLEDGVYMFSWSKLLKFKGALPSLREALDMFAWCSALTSFVSDTPLLKYGARMFNSNHRLKVFGSDLSSLQEGESMFYECESLEHLRTNLPALTKAHSMFNRCSSLKAFEVPTPKLREACYMFYGCENLRRFRGDLSSLVNAQRMFERCRLDADSVYHIADTLPSLMHRSEIGIGVAEEVDDEMLKPALEEMDAKNWDVVIDRRHDHNQTR